MYRKECEAQKLKVDKFVADGAEDWDIRNGVRRNGSRQSRSADHNMFQKNAAENVGRIRENDHGLL